MRIGDVHHVTISVRNLETSLAFYRDALGLRPVLDASFDDEGHRVYLGLPAGGHGRAVALRGGRPPAAGITLVEFTPAPGVAAPPLPAGAGTCMLAYELAGKADVDEVYEHVRAAGYDAVSKPTLAEVGGFGHVYGVAVCDPDGLMIEFYAPVAREVDA